jgi:hypothetical protein
MRNALDKKNRTAALELGLVGLRTVMGELANVNTRSEAQQFVNAHGPLDRKGSIGRIVVYAEVFRKAWKAKTEPKMIQEVNAFLAGVFGATDYFYGEGPVLAADFSSGKWEPRPRTLLDALAITLMRSRKMLHRCERPECQRYCVKKFSRDRYCTNLCSDDMRTRGQTQWALDHAAEINARRRKPRKKTRQRKTA